MVHLGWLTWGGLSGVAYFSWLLGCLGWFVWCGLFRLVAWLFGLVCLGWFSIYWDLITEITTALSELTWSNRQGQRNFVRR